MKDRIEEQMAMQNRLYKEQDDLYHSFALAFGLSDSAFWVLYALCESDQTYTQNELCAVWFYSKQTVNSAINLLVKDGYVVLKPIEGTRNRKAVLLTEAGKAFCKKTILPLLDAERRAFARFTNEERTAYLSLWERQLKLLREEAKILTES